MRDILSSIGNKLNRKITVDVSPEEFVFSNRHGTVALDTYLYLKPNTREDYSVLAISEHVDEPSCVKVDLFGPKSMLPDKVLRSRCLEAFLRFGFAKLLNQKMMLRPTVTFRGANSLTDVTGGQQRKVLSDAAKNAGAYTVEFLD